MLRKVVAERGVCIWVACQVFGVSELCHRYERNLDAENAEVANWLLRLTDNHRNWGFGLWALLSVFMLSGGLKMEPQACLRSLHRVGAELKDQAP